MMMTAPAAALVPTGGGAFAAICASGGAGIADAADPIQLSGVVVGTAFRATDRFVEARLQHFEVVSAFFADVTE